MTPTEIFQRQHGAKWAEIAKSEAFTAAMLLVNSEIIERVTRLTDSEIETHSKTLLADLRGRLAHETALMDLAVVSLNTSDDLPEPTYPNPIDEFAAEQATDEQDARTGGPFQEFQTEADHQPEPPKPKAVRRKRKRKK